jgi:hypothetical protein
MRISRPYGWMGFFLRRVYMVQLNVSDVDRVKKTKRKTHPVSLVIKQSSGCVQHLGIGFLLAHIGDKVGRVGMHLHRNLSKNLFTSASVISIHSYHGFSFIHLFLYLEQLVQWVYKVTRQPKGWTLRVKIDGCCRAATPQFARTTTMKNHHRRWKRKVEGGHAIIMSSE